MKITVLTCCYNSSKYLKESIESVLSQTYKEFEYLLIDDGSTDDTLNILQEFAKQDPRIRIVNKLNSGLTDSLNVGLKEAKGEWIARLDADDVALPYRLEKQLAYVSENKDVVLLGGGSIIIDDEGKELAVYNCPSFHHILVKRLEKNKAFFAHSTAFFHRRKVLEIGGYDSFFRLSQDKDLWLKIAEKYKLSCLSFPVIKLRKHDQMLTFKNNKLQIEYSILATVLHFVRTNDLSNNSDYDFWFQKTKDILADVKYFELISDWNDLKNKVSCDNNYKRLFLFCFEVLTNFKALKLCFNKVMMDKLLRKKIIILTREFKGR